MRRQRKPPDSVFLFCTYMFVVRRRSLFPFFDTMSVSISCGLSFKEPHTQIFLLSLRAHS